MGYVRMAVDCVVISALSITIRGRTSGRLERPATTGRTSHAIRVRRTSNMAESVSKQKIEASPGGEDRNPAPSPLQPFKVVAYRVAVDRA